MRNDPGFHPTISKLALLLAIVVAAPAGAGAEAEMRPLVREMLENLSSFNAIGDGLALDDFEGIALAADALDARATRLQAIDPAQAGIDPALDGEWDGFLEAQRKAASAMREAASRREGRGVVLAAQQLAVEACFACHLKFRTRERKVTISTVFMTNLLSQSHEMTRAGMVDDFALVARRAREIQGMAHVFTWDPVIEQTFEVSDPEARKRFGTHIRTLIAQAADIERAAQEGDRMGVARATSGMWSESCLACHDDFRKGAPGR